MQQVIMDRDVPNGYVANNLDLIDPRDEKSFARVNVNVPIGFADIVVAGPEHTELRIPTTLCFDEAGSLVGILTNGTQGSDNKRTRINVMMHANTWASALIGACISVICTSEFRKTIDQEIVAFYRNKNQADRELAGTGKVVKLRGRRG